jgi:D-aminopeptidase
VERLAEEDVPEPFVVETPVHLTVEFFSSDMADRAATLPFTEREGTCVSFTAPEMIVAHRAFRSMVTLGMG